MAEEEENHRDASPPRKANIGKPQVQQKALRKLLLGELVRRPPDIGPEAVEATPELDFYVTV